jgi:hypothetical protein
MAKIKWSQKRYGTCTFRGVGEAGDPGKTCHIPFFEFQTLKVSLSVLRRTLEMLMGQICATLGNPERGLVSDLMLS